MDQDELFATARIARLTLKQEEVERLRQAVEQMLGYFSHLKGLAVDDLAPTTHLLQEENRLRDDKESSINVIERILENAPEREDRFIVIPNVL